MTIRQMGRTRMRVHRRDSENKYTCMEFAALPDMSATDLMFLVKDVVERYDLVEYEGQVYEMGAPGKCLAVLGRAAGRLALQEVV